MNWYNEKIKQNQNYQTLKVSSDLKILYPDFAFLILKLFINAYQEGLRVTIFETYRSQERQLNLFNQGKTKLKKNGMHHFGIATDIVFRTEKNYPTWSSDNWDKLGQIGRDLGLFWGGDWTSFKDCPHFQLIPAIWEHQAKIVNGNYPEHDDKIDGYLEKIIPLYEAVKNDDYSEASFKNLVDGYSKLFEISKVEPETQPTPEEIKTTIVPDKKIEINKRKKNSNIWEVLFKLLVKLFKK